MLIVQVEMCTDVVTATNTNCKCGNKQFCGNVANTIEVVSGLAGVLLFGVGLQVISSVDVVVGKIPFAWMVGLLSIVGGGGWMAMELTVLKHKLKTNNEAWVYVVIASVLLGSGIYNVVANPRAPVICTCPIGYYGTDASGEFLPECLPCNCGRGTCADTVYGDGACICPPRYDPDSSCSVCVAGAEGANCERCKVGWRYFSDLSPSSCRECHPGYRKYNGQCDYIAPGIITHTCADGWETECFDQVGLLPPWVGTGQTNCTLDSIRPRTVVCDKCQANHTTRNCIPCPDCNTEDPEARCIMNERRPFAPSLSNIDCYDDYDCGSFHCSNGVCANEIRERADCECGSSNFAGPYCGNCTDNQVDIGLTCVQGVCQYHAAKKENYCMCNAGYESPSGYCSKKIQSGECETNYWGAQCERCGCQNGVCNDKSNGDGKCESCAYNTVIFTGYGMWAGEYCDRCAPGPHHVGCGDKCLPTPEQQVNHTIDGPRWLDNGAVCGDVQRCDRKGMDPCLIDCLSNGGPCPMYLNLQTWKSRKHRCEQAETYSPWYTCTAIDCSDSPCDHGTCTETNDGYECTCENGYQGHNCDTDINDCAGNPCGDFSHGYCTDTVGGFECTCLEGYSGIPCT